MKFWGNRSARLLTTAFLLLLTSCKTASSELADGCGLLYTYPKDFQQRAAGQVKQLELLGFEETSTLIEDYAKTRDSIRICQQGFAEDYH